MLQFFIGTLLTLSSLFLIALVLIQQGKGGGLAGAFGGQGGQSAFGTKAGDVFTRVTIITALVWIFFCMLAIKLISKDTTLRTPDKTAPAPAAAPLTPGTPATGTGTPATAGTAPVAPTPDPMTPAATSPAPMTSTETPSANTPAPTAPAPEAPAPASPSTPVTPEAK